MLYELSTPFLNIHWFLDKLGQTGSTLQLYNGILLIVTFFLCRVVWGTYQSVLIYSDIWTALTHASASSIAEGKCGGKEVGTGRGIGCQGDLPMWLVGVYLVGNTVLSLLNVYWFRQMVVAVRKRFRKGAKKEERRSGDGIGKGTKSQ